MTRAVKLCKDCKWSKVTFLEMIFGMWDVAKCRKGKTRLSDGGLDMFCDNERSFGPCGKEAKLFEARRWV